MTCDPDITEFKRTSKDKYIILACDGIWDCLTNEECVAVMDKKLAKKKPTKSNHADYVEELFGEIVAPSIDDGMGTDNMTCILVTLNNDNIV